MREGGSVGIQPNKMHTIVEGLEGVIIVTLLVLISFY